jgi:hypothetical protein
VLFLLAALASSPRIAPWAWYGQGIGLPVKAR